MPEPPVIRYHREENPNRPAILYLHGFLGCKEDWGHTVARLGESFFHLTVDLPGHGETADVSLSDHDFSMAGCAARLIELLDHLHIEKCHLVAYSMGGRLGLFLLTHHPERFCRAVIESASPGLEDESERTARKAHDNELADNLVGGDFRDFLKRWYAQPLFSTLDQADPKFDELVKLRSQCDPQQLARSLRLMGTGIQPSLWERLGEVTLPVLFVAGERDQKYRRLAESMHRLCPESQLAIIPGAGHNAHLERPAEFGEIVRRFLTENR